MKPALVWLTLRYSLRKVGSAAVRIHTMRSSFWKPLLSRLFGSSSHIFLLQDSGLANSLKAVTSTNVQDLDPIMFILNLNIPIYDTEIHFKLYLFKKDTFKHTYTHPRACTHRHPHMHMCARAHTHTHTHTHSSE